MANLVYYVGRKSTLRVYEGNRRNMGWHGFGVFDKAVSSWFDSVSEDHGLTEDGKTLPPFSRISVPKALRPLLEGCRLSPRRVLSSFDFLVISFLSAIPAFPAQDSVRGRQSRSAGILSSYCIVQPTR